MKKRLNKIPTNYTVALTPQEVTNLSETLSAVRTAGGGGTGGDYIGDGQYIGVDNNNNRISFLPDASTKLESVSEKLDKSTYAADSATFLTAHQSLSGYYQKTETSSKEQLTTEFEKYQTVAGMTEYLTTSNAQTTYLTKSSAEENLAPISVTADVEVLKANSGNFSQYYKKTETSSKEELSAEFNKYQTKADMENYATVQSVLDLESNLLIDISNKQDKLTFAYDNNKISAINGSALAGQGGTTYSAGAGISIVDEYINLSADYIQAITQVSGKQDVLAFTYDSSGSIIKINNSAIAGGAGGGSVSYTGRNGVEINGNYIELETTAKNAIDSVGGISTDVGTLKTASAGWDKVSDKLDTTAFSTVSGTFLTTIPDTYATKEYANNASANALSEAETWVGQQGFYTKASGDNDYAPISITATVNTLTAASASWNEVSAKLGTAQYAEDSATFVTSSNSTITGTKQYALTTAGWAEVSTTIPAITATSGISADGFSIGLTNTAIGAITSVSSKVDKPDTSLTNKYLVLRTDSNGAVSGWYDLQDQSYSKSEADRTFVATANIDTTLSGGTSSSTKLGVKTDVIATRDYVNSSFLPLSGGTVSGDVKIYSSGTNLLTVNTTATLMGQSRVANLTDTTALGTNWLGVNSNGGGFLKNVQGGNVGALNGTSIQIDFAPNGNTAYGNITVNSQDNVSKVVHVPTASYNSMSSFDNTNGPNYMLRKTASGFDIGAAVINVQSLPAQTEANAYYFVYDT